MGKNFNIYILIITILAVVHIAFNKDYVKIIDVPGNLTLIGLFNYYGTLPGREKCSVTRPADGLLTTLAMKYAVTRVNNDSRIMPSINLGLTVYDICNESNLQSTILNILIKKNMRNTVGVIGPTKVEDTSTVGMVMSLYHMAMITFNDVPLSIDYRPYFEIQYWAVPVIMHSVRALTDFIVKMDWNFIGMFYQNSVYGWQVSKAFSAHAMVNGICLYDSVLQSVGTSINDYSKAMLNSFIKGDDKVKVIVLFLEEDEIIKFIHGLRELHGHPRMSQITFLSLSKFGTKELVAREIKNLTTTFISFQPYYKMEEDFPRYFYSDEFLNNKLVQSFQKEVCGHNSSKCTSKTHLREMFGDIYNSKASAIINSVYAFASCLHYLQLHNKTFGRRIINSKLKNLTSISGRSTELPFRRDIFVFQDDRRISPFIGIYNYQEKPGQRKQRFYKKIGSWTTERHKRGILKVNISAIRWASGLKPASTCKVNCSAGQVKLPRKLFEYCCDECIDCLADEIIINNTCTTCQKDEQANHELNQCVKLPVKIVHVNRTLVETILVLSWIEIGLIIISFSLFIHYRKTRVIKSASRELTSFIFLGLIIMSTVPLLTFHYTPSHKTCFIEPLIFFLGFTFVFAPLFLKTNRVYRIFQAAHSSAAPPKIVSPLSQILMTLFLCAVEVLLCIPRIKVVKISYLYPTHRRFIEVYCEENSLIFFINTAYVIFLMISTTFYAFKTRHFPKNYNESKYIGFTMYITCFICTTGLVTFFLSTDNGTKMAAVIMTSLLCSYTCLLGLFLHKFLTLFKSKDEERKRNTQEIQTQTSTVELEHKTTKFESPRLWDLRRFSQMSIVQVMKTKSFDKGSGCQDGGSSSA